MRDGYSFDDRQQIIAGHLEEALNKLQQQYARSPDDMVTVVLSLMGFAATIWSDRNRCSEEEDRGLVEHFQSMIKMIRENQ